MRDGKVFARDVEASEKVYMDLRLEVAQRRAGTARSRSRTTRSTGWRPRSTALSRYEFPPRLNDVTRSYFTRAAAAEPDSIAARMRMVGETGDTTAMRRLSAGSPWLSSILRTTCVATRLDGGHANNALPQTAGANVNCRLLPDERPEDVIETIQRVVADTAVHITVTLGARAVAAFAARARGPGADRQHNRGDVAGCGGGAEHGCGRVRWPVSPQRRDAGVRRVRGGAGLRRHPMAWEGRADHGRGVLSGAGVHVSPGAGAGGERPIANR